MTADRCGCARVNHKHGTEARYSRDHCRCLPCRLARHRYVAAWRTGQATERRTVPIIGTRRRLQALTVMGWSPPEIAERVGMDSQIVRRLRSNEASSPRYGDTATVLATTKTRVEAVYDQLWNVASPGPKATRMRRLAQANNWAPPLAWDDDTIDDRTAHAWSSTGPSTSGLVDDVAVDQAIHGRPVRLSKSDVREVVQRMTDAGYSAAAIAERLGVSERTIVRKRAA